MNIHEHLKKLKTAQSSSRATDNNSAAKKSEQNKVWAGCLLYTSPSPRDVEESRMPASA